MLLYKLHVCLLINDDKLIVTPSMYSFAVLSETPTQYAMEGIKNVLKNKMNEVKKGWAVKTPQELLTFQIWSTEYALPNNILKLLEVAKQTVDLHKKQAEILSQFDPKTITFRESV